MEWGGINQELGVNTHTLLYIKQILNKDLLYSTGNPAQYYVAAWVGGEFGGKMDAYVCMAESLCCPPESVTMLLICYTPI